MKIKDDILRWQEEVRKLCASVKEFNKMTDDYSKEVKALNEKVEGLTKITEEMTEMILALIRQQIGD